MKNLKQDIGNISEIIKDEKILQPNHLRSRIVLKQSFPIVNLKFCNSTTNYIFASIKSIAYEIQSNKKRSTHEEFLAGIKKAEEGSFYTVEDLKSKVDGYQPQNNYIAI